MSKLAILGDTVPAISLEMLAKVQTFEEKILQQEQISIDTEHVIHGGMYTRTVRVAADVLFTGALTKRPTMLIIHGNVRMLVGETAVDLTGYNVFTGSAGRKQVFRTFSPTEITMIFPTEAVTVALAEAEITDQANLLSRRQGNHDTITITGE